MAPGSRPRAMASTWIGPLAIALLLGISHQTPRAASADPPGSADAAPTTGAGPDVPGTGTVAGTVSYRGDGRPPTRPGRDDDDLKGDGAGELAGAVVALSRRGLRGPEEARVPA